MLGCGMGGDEWDGGGGVWGGGRITDGISGDATDDRAFAGCPR